MARNATADVLEQLIQQVRAWAKEHSVRVLEGFVEKEGDLLTVLHNEEGESSLSSFLEAARSFEPAVLVLHITRLTHETWKSSMAEYDDVEDLDDQQAADLRAVQELEGSIGSVAAVELGILTKQPCMLLKYQRFAEWFELIYSSDDEKANLRLDDEDEPANEALIEEFGRKLASDRSYQNARNDIQRRSALGKVLGADPRLREVETWDVLERAKSIYEAEFRASHEAWLVEAAIKLQRQGLKKSEIAVQLGVSINKVKDLLS